MPRLATGSLTFFSNPFISTLMAIRRCPYCKAIIDESQKYCNNCGTQLLFPEDDQIEEDIKGEKLVDDDFKDTDEELEDSLESREGGEEQHEVIDLGEVLEGETGFPDELELRKKARALPPEDEIAEKLDKVEEEPPLPKKGRTRRANPPVPSAPVKVPPRRPTANVPPPPPENIEAVMPSPPPLAPPSAPAPAPVGKISSREYILEPPSASEDLDLETDLDPDREAEADEEEDEEGEDAEKRDTEADTKEEIARLIEALEKKHKKANRLDTGEKILAPVDASDDLPPWADHSADTSPPERVVEEAEEKMESSSFVPGDTMDFQDEVMRRAEAAAPAKPTIGMPETPVKKDSACLFDREEDDRPAIIVPPPVPSRASRRMPKPMPPARGAGEPPAGAEEFASRGFAPSDAASDNDNIPAARIGLGFFRRIAAVFFDLVFVAALWLTAVGLASLLMAAAARDLVLAATLPLGLLFAVLFAGYLFLFFFFLGETLGGRLLARRESSRPD